MVQVIRDPQTRREVLYIDNPPPRNWVGGLGLIFSALGLVTCGVLSPVGLILSLLGLRGKRRGGAIAGTLLGLAGLAIPGAALFHAVKQDQERHREQVVKTTRGTLEAARMEIDSYRGEQGTLPDGVAGNKLLLQFRDPWNHELRYELHDGDRSYSLRSAGPDERFDTRDDVSIAIGSDALHEPIGGKATAEVATSDDEHEEAAGEVEDADDLPVLSEGGGDLK